MKKVVFCLAALTWMSVVNAQTGEEWDNPTISHVNREKAHKGALPMTSETDVVKNNLTLSPYYQSLDGTWKFNWVKSRRWPQRICARRTITTPLGQTSMYPPAGKFGA